MTHIATTQDLFGVEDVTGDPSTPEGREALLRNAVADGRLIEASVPTWRRSLERAPDRAAAELAGLTSLRPIVSADPTFDRLFPGQAR